MDSHYPFIGVIDISSDNEFNGIMEPCPSYHIVEVHDSNMISVTTRMSRDNDQAPPPPPNKVIIQQPSPKDEVHI